jgi:hypothetical protein
MLDVGVDRTAESLLHLLPLSDARTSYARSLFRMSCCAAAGPQYQYHGEHMHDQLVLFCPGQAGSWAGAVTDREALHRGWGGTGNAQVGRYVRWRTDILVGGRPVPMEGASLLSSLDRAPRESEKGLGDCHSVM